MLEGLVDIYLPDFKYISTQLAAEYSSAADYAEVATAALAEMHRQTGAVRLDAEGMMQSGGMVRHLVLPGVCHRQSGCHSPLFHRCWRGRNAACPAAPGW